MDDAAPTREAVGSASSRSTDDKAVGDGVREVTTEDRDRDMGEVRCSAAVKDDFVEGVCFAVQDGGRSRGRRVGGIEAYF